MHRFLFEVSPWCCLVVRPWGVNLESSRLHFPQSGFLALLGQYVVSVLVGSRPRPTIDRKSRIKELYLTLNEC